jgi:hypothetical protein
MFRDSKYIFIDNCFELGKFYAHHGTRTPFAIMQPVFRIVTIENLKEYELEAGYLDRKENFYKCPLEIHYLKINKYLIKREFVDAKSLNKIIISLYFEIFDLDYINSIESEIMLWEYEYQHFDFMRFNPIINYLNLYIKSGRKIKDLNFSILDKFYPQSNSLEKIIGLINDLEMKIFEDSQSRVGKDNRFWEDLEIRNLPENLYFKQLIIKCFEKQGKRCKVTDFGLSIELCSDYAWSPSYRRRELENYETADIKDRLKVLLAVEFDSLEFTLSGMEINTAHNSR